MLEALVPILEEAGQQWKAVVMDEVVAGQVYV
jgi:hypothetical protein